MKFIFLHLSSKNEEWCENALDLYSKKIGHFIDFEVVALKPKKSARGEESYKIQAEASAVLDFLRDGDELVLFDERGTQFTSEKFAEKVRTLHESGKKRVLFLIGGAYGVSDEVRKRSKTQIALAPFVMNHLVAQVVACEQIYRAFTILKGLPYHNN